MRRELIADGIESHGKTFSHRLRVINMDPGLIHRVALDPSAESCLYVDVKITIRSSQRETKSLYQQSRHVGGTPMIQNCRPSESPTFLHGRPTTITYDIIFSTRPYLSSHEKKDQDVQLLREAFKVKAQTVSLADGVKTELHLAPVRVYENRKDYRDDEFHVGVTFDLAEYQNSATEKLIFA